MQENSLIIPWLLDNLVCRSFRFVDEIGIKDIELVSLDNFGRWVVDAENHQDVIPLKFKSESVLIMSLIVLVPFIAGMNAVEIARFTRSILVFPVIARCTSDILLKVK